MMANRGERVSDLKGTSVAPGDLMSKDTWMKMHDGKKLAIDASFPGGVYTTIKLLQ